MASVPGLSADVYFGSTETPLPDWRKELPDDHSDEDDLSEDRLRYVIATLGFDPMEEEDATHNADEEDKPLDQDEVATLIADILRGLFGEDAERLFDADGEAETVATTNAAKWDPLHHPRGKGGRFIPKGSAEAVSTAREAIGKVLKGERTTHSAEDVAKHLSILTVKQLRDLHREHGVKSAGKLRDHLVEAVRGRLPKDAGQSGKPEKVTPQSFDSPSPPEPNYTGKDTLGRHWQGGKLTGQVDPPDEKRTEPFDQKSRFNVVSMFGKIETLQPDEVEAIKREVGETRLLATSRVLLTGIDEDMEGRLARRGLTDDIGYLTPKGIVAYINATGHALKTGQLAPPTTKEHLRAWTVLLNAANPQQRKAMLEHLGYSGFDTEKPPDGFAMRGILETRALQTINGNVGAKLREAKEVHAAVARLSNLTTSDEALAEWKAAGGKWRDAQNAYLQHLNDKAVWRSKSSKVVKDHIAS